MKKILLIIVLFVGDAVADSWGPESIEFKLETSSKIETMHWISGFSYSATAFYRRCGALESSEYIGSKYLIDELNKLYEGRIVTSEQATITLDEALDNDYHCKAL